MTDETPDVVSRARAALDGITPGPWRRPAQVLGLPNGGIFAEGGKEVVIIAHSRPGDADGDFVAAAPDLIRELLARVEKAQAWAAWFAAKAHWLDHDVAVIAERDEARAAVMRVIAACVDADLESVAFTGEPGVVKTTVIRRALDREA